jgi:hypothetical protein
LNVEQKISYLVENNLINIDSDLFQGTENKTKLVEKDEVENEVIEIEVKPKVKKLRIVKPKKKLLIVEEDETA